jgi:hypothetical protein
MLTSTMMSHRMGVEGLAVARATVMGRGAMAMDLNLAMGHSAVIVALVGAVVAVEALGVEAVVALVEVVGLVVEEVMVLVELAAGVALVKVVV